MTAAPSNEVNLPAALAWAVDAPFYQAGLAGYSDTAMRMIARRHGCPYCITEAMLDQLLIGGGKGLRIADLNAQDHPIAGQIIGSTHREMSRATKILLGMGYDAIDVNFGCPMRKIRRRGRGGHLLAEPDKAASILDAVRQVVGDDVPVTLKMRRAFDDSPEMLRNFYEVFDKALELGYAMITVHGRTVRQKYVGGSSWPFLADLTRRYRSEMDRGLLIFGSGDIFSAEAIFQMIEQTGVSGASVARGCIGNPWIFRQARQIIAGEQPTAPSIDEQRSVLREHFELSAELHGEKLAGRLMRKFGINFASHHPQRELVKMAFVKVKSKADWQAVLDEYYQQDM